MEYCVVFYQYNVIAEMETNSWFVMFRGKILYGNGSNKEGTICCVSVFLFNFYNTFCSSGGR